MERNYFKAIWRRKDGDFPITIVKSLGFHEAREYVKILESTTGIPLDECISVEYAKRTQKEI